MGGCKLKSGLPVEPVVVGRDKEIGQLMRCLDSALKGNGTTVFICGEAGIGKTRLVNEFLDLAGKTGAKILKGWCLSEAAIPYFPFIEAFNTCISTLGDEKEKSAVTNQLGITGWLKGPPTSREPRVSELFSTPEIERDRTFEAAARILFQLSTKEPSILFLDDLHWADHLSLALLHYLSRKCRNSQLLIIGTYRTEELVRTKEEQLHPLEETIFAMSRGRLLTKMELSRLKRNDFPELLRSIFHSSFDEEFVEKLHRETDGNPLFALEALNLLVEEGFLSEREGQWILATPIDKIGIPSRVHEVITRRISRLKREERKMLDLAAVCGHSFNPDILGKTLALDMADVLEKLAEIQRRHRLIRSIDSTFEFTHEKIREVIYDDLQGGLRRAYHLKTASCLEQVLADNISDDYLADIAFHYDKGGVPEKAFEYFIRLGENAVQISANAQAIDYLNKALEVTEATASLASSENLARIYKIRGRAWIGRGEVAKAVDDFKLLLQNATSFGDESMLAEAHYWLSEALTKQYKWRATKRNLLRAIEMARKTGNKLVESRSLASLGWTLIWDLNTLEESRRQLEESSKISLEIGDKLAYARSCLWLGFFYNWRGEFKIAKESINEALKLFDELGDRFHVLQALMFLGWINCGKGEYNNAILAIQRCLQLAQKWDIVYWDRAPFTLMLLGWIYRDLSNIELALRYDSEALENSKLSSGERAKSGIEVAALVDLGMDYLHKNDYENAERFFKEVDPTMHSVATWRIEVPQLLGLAEIALAKGEFENALKSVEDSFVKSEKASAKKYIAKGLKLKAEVLANMGNLGEAVELMRDALKLAQQVGNPPILWQTHHSMGLLLEKRGDLQEANEHHAEAIALIEATAAKLSDPTLKNSLLNDPLTSAIRDAYAKTKPTS